MLTVGTTTFTVTLPMPDRHLNPNRRISERYRQQVRRGHRDMAILAAKDALNRLGGTTPLFPRGQPLVVTAHCRPPRLGRRWDNDNLRAALKGYLDGFQLAGVYPDDKDVDVDRVFWYRPDGPGEVELEVRIDTRARAAAIEAAARAVLDAYRSRGNVWRMADAIAALEKAVEGGV